MAVFGDVGQKIGLHVVRNFGGSHCLHRDTCHCKIWVLTLQRYISI
jgi:hypothetical protein